MDKYLGWKNLTFIFTLFWLIEKVSKKFCSFSDQWPLKFLLIFFVLERNKIFLSKKKKKKKKRFRREEIKTNDKNEEEWVHLWESWNYVTWVVVVVTWDLSNQVPGPQWWLCQLGTIYNHLRTDSSKLACEGLDSVN